MQLHVPDSTKHVLTGAWKMYILCLIWKQCTAKSFQIKADKINKILQGGGSQSFPDHNLFENMPTGNISCVVLMPNISKVLFKHTATLFTWSKFSGKDFGDLKIAKGQLLLLYKPIIFKSCFQHPK